MGRDFRHRNYKSPADPVRAIMENDRRLITQSRSNILVLSLLAGFSITFGAELAKVVTHDAAALLGGVVFVVSAYWYIHIKKDGRSAL